MTSSISTPRLVRDMRWGLALAWGERPRLVLGLVALTVVRGVTPAAWALVLRRIVDVAVDAHAVAGVGPWLALGALLTAADLVGRLLERHLALRLTDELDLVVTTRILEHAARLEVASFEDPVTQDVIHRARQNPAGHLARFLVGGLGLAAQVVQILSLAWVIAAVEPWTLAILGPFALLHLGFQWRLSRAHYLDEHARARKRRWARYHTTLLTTRSTAAEVRQLGLASLLIQRFGQLAREFRDVNRERFADRAWTGGSFAVAALGAFFALFLRVLARFRAGLLSVGDLVVYFNVGLRLHGALEGAVGSVNEALTHALHAGHLREFLALEVPVVPRPEAAGAEAPGRRAPAGAGAPRGALSFDDVVFTYPGAGRRALDGVRFQVEPGERVALVGPNGAGKTTLTALLACFYSPESGAVLLDGEDVRQLEAAALRARVALVPQSPTRFEASVHDNVAFGDWERLANDTDEVRRLTAAVGLDAFVDRLPSGHATTLGRQFGEHELSAGQWRRLAVARALGRRADVIVLDEPTAHLDVDGERMLLERFDELTRGRTTLFVSHSLRLALLADRIVVLEEGRVTQAGTAAELLARGGYFADLYAAQRGAEPPGERSA